MAVLGGMRTNPPWDDIKLIQEHSLTSAHAQSSLGVVVSVPLALCAPVFMNTLVVSGTGSLGMAPLNSSTPPIKYLVGTLAELRFLVAGVLQAGNA